MTHTGKKHSDVFIYSRGIILLLQTVFGSAPLIKRQTPIRKQNNGKHCFIETSSTVYKTFFFSEVFKLRHKS